MASYQRLHRRGVPTLAFKFITTHGYKAHLISHPQKTETLPLPVKQPGTGAPQQIPAPGRSCRVSSCLSTSQRHTAGWYTPARCIAPKQGYILRFERSEAKYIPLPWLVIHSSIWQ